MKSTYTGRIRVIAVALSCFFSLTISLLSPLGAKARDLEEILDSGYLTTSLRDRDTVWHPTGPKQLQERIVEIFAENLSRKFKKAIKLKKIIVPDFSTFWKDKSGVVRQGDTYTPAYLSKVDLYADILTVNEWRKKLVLMIPFMPVKELIFCRGVAAVDIQDLIAQKLYVYSTKTTSFHTLLQAAQFPEKRIIFVRRTGDILPALHQGGKQACAILDSDSGLYQTRRLPGLKMTGVANESISQIGWATARSSGQLAREMREFFRKFQKTKRFKELFQKQYGLSYNDYLKLLTTL